MLADNDLLQLLSDETKVRQEASPIEYWNPVSTDDEANSGGKAAPSNNSFAPAPPPPPAKIEDDDYDPELEAEKRVEFMDAMMGIILAPAAQYFKLKGIGGKKQLNKFKSAYNKKIKGQELTAEEEQFIKEFELYKKDLEILEGKISISTADKEMLKKVAIPMAKEHRIKTDSMAVFYTVFASILVKNGFSIINM
jgi:hypothetical protein